MYLSYLFSQCYCSFVCSQIMLVPPRWHMASNELLWAGEAWHLDGAGRGCWAGVAHTLTHLHQHTHTHTHTTWLAGQQISQRRKPEMKLGPKPQVVVVKMFACTLSNGCLDLLWLLAFSCCS